MKKPLLPILLALACLPWLSACGNQQPQSPDEAAPLANVSAEMREEMRGVSKKVREELATENIEISDSDEPQAEITPQGDFLIEGREVEITPDQRALLLEYRGHIAYLAETGAQIGMQGVSLATDALGDAFAGMFTGTTEKLEAKIEAKAEKIAEQAMTLVCGRMPAMLRTEQQLAASLPEFAPYADMEQADIDDCQDGARIQ